MLAILGGLGAALCWALSSLASARSARRIGAWSTVAWVMLIGSAIAIPVTFVAGGRPTLSGTAVVLLVASGLSNVVGLVLIYSAFRIGKVAVLAPIASTEGAMGAVIAVLLGEQVTPLVGAILAAIAIGIVLATAEREADATVEPGGLAAIDPEIAGGTTRGLPARAVVLGLVSAFLFGINLYASARIGAELPVIWSILPARVAGTIGLAIPLLLLGRLRLSREALPFVLIVAVCEIVGTAVYALGAQDGIAVAAVTSSQFGAIAAIASVALFGERLRRIQLAGVVVIAAGVAALAALQAG